MEYEWDEAKRRSNLSEHGIDFGAVEAFEWRTALTEIDRRFPYPEERFQSFGFIGGRLFVIVLTPPLPGLCRVINLRKVNRREVRKYGHAYEDGRIPSPDSAGSRSDH